MVDYHILPPELWLEILSWAILPSSRDPNTQTIGYAPFQSAPVDTKDPTLSVKRTLTLVCQLWKVWMAGPLYREIKVRHGADALQRALSLAAPNHEDYGRLVRRVVLPYSSTTSSPPNSPTPISIEILRRCPQLEVLVRPCRPNTEVLRFDFEVDCVLLPSLRRLEWWHDMEAERSGGINSLGIVLKHAPNVEYLFIGGVMGYTGLTPVCLPSLRTLRLNVINGLLLHQISTKWDLPSMTHVIFDSPLVEKVLDGVWGRFGEQLEVVEFGKHLRFLMNDHLTDCLQGCPKLREIGYYLFFTTVPGTIERHTQIKTVRLHSRVNNFFQTIEEIWTMLEGHFRFLNQLPSLNKIILHGEWRGILEQRRFQVILKQLYETRGSTILEYADSRN